MAIAGLELWDSQLFASHIVREIERDSPIHPFNQGLINDCCQK